ncbi:hypothetical protein H0A73_17400 [Alcaligenaceae bacterium]|nr:hypothetical protein [Alcaligenaceae bacterium]
MKQNIEILLGEWGAWKRGENRSALGYPDRSAFTVMRVDGMRHTDPDVLLVDDDMRRLDAEIIELHPDFRAVITAHYVRPGPVKTKIDDLGISRSLYFFRLDFATKQVGHKMWHHRPETYAPVTAII